MRILNWKEKAIAQLGVNRACSLVDLQRECRHWLVKAMASNTKWVFLDYDAVLMAFVIIIIIIFSEIEQ